MYLFSAIKDAIFTGRRSSVSGDQRRFSESAPTRRASVDVHMSADRTSTEPDREGPIGSKAKRSDQQSSERPEQELKRRRTLGSSERDIGLLPRGSVGFEPVLRSRQQSPLPRHSMPGPEAPRRHSLIGSPLPVASLSQAGGSPRISSRPQTPTHPRFVDLLKRDPSQQRALDTARSILETLDRVTTGTVPIGGSARKYRPPQPLRPMRFKSLSSSRGVSLHDMLSGAVSSVPPSPQAPAIQRLSPVSIPATASSPRHGLLLPPGAMRADSPRNVMGSAPSPKRSLDNPVPESPKRVLLSQPAVGQMSPLKQPSPLKKPTIQAPPAGTFIWGDPSKVSDADFIEDDGFAPGADDSSSDESDKPQTKTDVSSIFGTGPTAKPSIFGTDTSSTLPSIFGSAPAAKPEASGSLFGEPAKKPETTPLFGASTKMPEQTSSIFGGETVKKADETSSIFGGEPANKTGTTSLFGAAPVESSKKTETSSLFGTAPVEPAKKTETSSLFGSAPVESTKKTETSSLFGSAPVEPSKTPSSLFGGNDTVTFAGAAAEKKDLPSSFTGMFESKPVASDTPKSGMFVFGTTPPASPGAAPKPQPSLFGAPASQPTSIFGGAPSESSAPPSNIFGSAQGAAATPSSNIFGGTSKPTGIFGSSSGTTAPVSSIFGASQPAAPPTPSNAGGIFGTSTAPAGTNVFGSQPAAAPNMFGTTPQQQTVSFGAVSQPGTPSNNSLFGAAAAPTPSGSSIFGGAPGGMFGSAAPTDQSSSAFSFGQAVGTPTSNAFGGSAGGMFGAAASGGDNPFAAGAGDFGQSAPKRKILKAARRT